MHSRGRKVARVIVREQQDFYDARSLRVSFAMAQARLIVCEKTSRWAIGLRSALAESGVRVYETRTWADGWRAVEEAPASLLAIELRRGNLAEVVRGLGELRRRFPEAGAVVLTSRVLKHCEWTLREAGALHVVSSPRNLVPLASLVRRFLNVAVQPEQGLRDEILERLPWGS